MKEDFAKLASDAGQYDKDEIDWNKDGHVESPARKYFNYYLLSKLDVKGKSVLDVGCGFGTLFGFLKEMGAAKLVGLEPSKGSYNFLSNKYPYVESVNLSLQEYKTDNKFDAIICIMAFEHMLNLSGAYSKISQLLTIGGKFYLLLADMDYALTPRHGFEIESQNLPDGGVAMKTKREWGVAYDMYRPISIHVDIASKCGLSLLEHTPIYPNDETLKIWPKLKEFRNISSFHILIYKNKHE